MERFLNFFFGTPQKILVWIIIGVVVLAACNLDVLEVILNRMIYIALNKILPLAIVVGLIVYILKRLTK